MRAVNTEWYWAAMNSRASVPAEVHRRLWKHTPASDEVLRASLVARIDAPADLVEVYARLTEPALRNAYLSRPDADHGAAAYTGPTTAKGLCDALATSAWAAPVLEAALAHFEARPSRALAQRLLDTPPKLRTSRLARVLFDFADSTGLDTEPAWESLAGHAAYLTREDAEQLLRRLCRAQPLVPLLLLDVDDGAVLDAVVRVGQALAKFVGDNNVGLTDSGFQIFSSFLAAATSRDRDVEAIEAALYRDMAADSVAHAQKLASSSPFVRARRRTRPIDYIAPTPSAADPAGDLTEQLATADGPDLVAWAHSSDPRVHEALLVRLDRTITELVAAYGRNQESGLRLLLPTWVESLSFALISSATTTAAQRLHVTRALGTLPSGLLPDPTVDAVAMRPDDVELSAAWCRLWPDAVISRHGWAPFEKVAPRTQWLSEWSTHWAADGRGRGAGALWAAVKSGLPTPHLVTLPWQLLRSARLTCPDVASQVLEHLSQTFADTVGIWATFEMIEESFTGSFADLTNVCVVAAS